MSDGGSMSDDELNALLAAWSQDVDGTDVGGDVDKILAELSGGDAEASGISGGEASGNSGGDASWNGGGQASLGSGSGCGKGGKAGMGNAAQSMLSAFAAALAGAGKGAGACTGKGGNMPGKSKAAVRIGNGDTLYLGKVKSYDAEKKRGYIVCDEIFNKTGMDVYVFGSVLEPTGAEPGDTVVFFVHWSKAGQPQGSAPMLRIAAEGYAFKGQFKGVDPKGHGFILCDITKEFFGRDVYCNPNLAAVLTPGQTVAFNVYLNKDKMPNAEKAEEVDQAWEPPPGDLSCSRTDPNVVSNAVKGGSKGTAGGGAATGMMASKGGGGMKGPGGGGAGKGMKEMMFTMMSAMMGGGFGNSCGGNGGFGGAGKGAAGGGGQPGPPPEATGETFHGVIKSFNQKNNYGFIASEEVQHKYNGVDCFYNGKFFDSFPVGTAVEFDVGLNIRGQPQAVAIRSLGSSEEPAAKMQRTE